ncbi:hypothetical protein EDB80DRAFT_426050 [Ilyonectria destructans]|nr:hypothetical protein EDB80DRAFT_426050 [Ilyonectria destructans]
MVRTLPRPTQHDPRVMTNPASARWNIELPGRRHTWRRSVSARTYRFSKYLHLLGSLVENHPAGGNRDLSKQYLMPTKGPLAETRPSTRLHSMIDDLAKHRNGPVLEYDVYSYLVILCVCARECVCVARAVAIHQSHQIPQRPLQESEIPSRNVVYGQRGEVLIQSVSSTSKDEKMKEKTLVLCPTTNVWAQEKKQKKEMRNPLSPVVKKTNIQTS